MGLLMCSGLTHDLCSEITLEGVLGIMYIVRGLLYAKEGTISLSPKISFQWVWLLLKQITYPFFNCIIQVTLYRS